MSGVLQCGHTYMRDIDRGESNGVDSVVNARGRGQAMPGHQGFLKRSTRRARGAWRLETLKGGRPSRRLPTLGSESAWTLPIPDPTGGGVTPA